jgi:hypothetical protein
MVRKDARPESQHDLAALELALARLRSRSAALSEEAQRGAAWLVVLTESVRGHSPPTPPAQAAQVAAALHRMQSCEAELELACLELQARLIVS